MNKKRIKEHLSKVTREWLDSIKDDKVRELASENVIITGGALVSLLTNTDVNDYDMYFKTKEACKAVAEYYAKEYNGTFNVLVEEKEDRIMLKIKSGCGTQSDTSKDIIVKIFKCPKCEDSWKAEIKGSKIITSDGIKLNPENKMKCFKCGNLYDVKIKEKFQPQYFSANAITLTDNIQIVIRFYGNIEDIHKNYDFVHCTCSYDFKENKLNLPNDALLAIINKQLIFQGSKYPVCSLVRMRKFIGRGYNVSAGEIFKMVYLASKKDFTDIEVLREELCGVDSIYFEAFIRELEKMKRFNGESKVNETEMFNILNRIFNGE